MRFLMRKLVATLLFALLLPITTSAAELRLAVDASTEMPWAEIRQDELVGGIHLALGQAIAARLGRPARFLVLPRQRLSHALEHGDVDVACVLTPEWLPGPFDWTPRFIDDADVVLSLKSVAAPQRIEDLAGVPLGTINGFHYPALEQGLGPRFVRDDAPSATHNLRKLSYGRLAHVVTNERLAVYLQSQGQLTVALHPPLVISRYRTGCAVSRHGHATAAELSAAVEKLQRSGELAQLLNQYH